jgi:hypothetical protein
MEKITTITELNNFLSELEADVLALANAVRCVK